jgi:hypothetical protein
MSLSRLIQAQATQRLAETGKSASIVIALLCALSCKDKDRLLFEYNRRVQEWSRAVLRLSEQAGASLGNYTTFLSGVDEARAKTEQAKHAYEKHVGEHGC